MTVQIDLSPETEARLSAEARVRGLPLENLGEQLLSEALSVRSPSQRRTSVDEFHQMLADIAEGSERLPELPTESFSRESFYKDGPDGRDPLSRR
jgi:hypothetical protein